MFLDGWIQYFNLHNGHRITGLSAHDPFAVFGFILLLLIVPTAIILLTVVARRSVHSIFDSVRYESRYQHLRRAPRPSLLPTSQARASYRSDRTTVGSKRVSFVLPMSPAMRRYPGPAESAPMLKAPAVSWTPLVTLSRGQASPAGSTFEDVFDRWHDARRPPRLEFDLEDAEANRQWTKDFLEELRNSALQE